RQGGIDIEAVHRLEEGFDLEALNLGIADVEVLATEAGLAALVFRQRLVVRAEAYLRNALIADVFHVEYVAIHADAPIEQIGLEAEFVRPQLLRAERPDLTIIIRPRRDATCLVTRRKLGVGHDIGRPRIGD